MSNELLADYLKNSIAATPSLVDARTRDLKGRMLFHRPIFYALEKQTKEFLAGTNIENRWIAVPGLRGTGKTTLLLQVYRNILQDFKIPQANVVYASLDLVSRSLGGDVLSLVKVYEELIGRNLSEIKAPVFFLLDEVQYDKNWAIAVKAAIYEKSNKTFVITTGSSALALQTNPDAARRILFEKAYPLRLTEYYMLKYHKTPPRDLGPNLARVIFSAETPEKMFMHLNLFYTAVREFVLALQPRDIESFLRTGTLAFSVHLENEKDVFERVQNSIEKIITDDLMNLGSFDKKTLNTIPRILDLLSVRGTISYENLSSAVALEKITLMKVLDSLSKAELINPIPPHGSVDSRVTKSYKNLFSSPAIRAALMDKVNRPIDHGLLFEDMCAMILRRLKEKTDLIQDFTYDARDGGADFIVRTHKNQLLPIEVSYGKKSDNKQVIATMDRVGAKFGVVVSDKPLEIKGGIVNIPIEMFLLL